MADTSIIRKEGSSCTELMQCFLGLSSNECTAFYMISGRGGVTLDELAEWISRDRSTTHRLLQKLVTLGLCYKEKENISRGGYIHRYEAVSKERLKDILDTRIKEYVNDLEKLASCLDSDLERKMNEFR